MAVEPMLLYTLPLGTPPKDWEVVQLKEVTSKIGSGATPRGGDNVYKSSGVSLIRSQNVYDHEFKMKGLVHIDNEEAEKLSGVTVQTGDVLLNITGHSITRCCIAPEEILPARVNQHVAIIRPTERLNNIFLQKYLSHSKVKVYTLSHDAGGTRKALTKGHIENFLIPLPPPLEQHRIAEVLGALDDKIELNNRMNKTLEEMAAAIFKSWFVDFEPFKEGEFEYSEELGKDVPEGWGVVQIKDIGEVITGKTPPTKDPENYGDEVSFITIPDMHGNIFTIETAKYLSRKGTLTQPKKELPKYSVCVSCIATPGLVVLTSEKSHTNQQINSIVCNERVSPFYVYHYMNLLGPSIVNLGSGGTATLNLNKGDFESIKILLPRTNDLINFHNAVSPLFEKILYNMYESRTLATIRDSLLPKLMSGEIRVKVVEEELEILEHRSERVDASPTAIRFKPFKEAVLVASLVDEFSEPKYPMSRFRYTKFSYFTKRHLGEDVTSQYAKMTAGPYDHRLRYHGPEKIALEKGYIKKADGKRFLSGPNISKAKKYTDRYKLKEAIEWVSSELRFEKNDMLELLSTIDYAVLELQSAGKKIDPASIRKFIESHPEWAKKLKKDVFSPENVHHGLKKLQKLFPETYQDVEVTAT